MSVDSRQPAPGRLFPWPDPTADQLAGFSLAGRRASLAALGGWGQVARTSGSHWRPRGPGSLAPSLAVDHRIERLPFRPPSSALSSGGGRFRAFTAGRTTPKGDHQRHQGQQQRQRQAAAIRGIPAACTRGLVGRGLLGVEGRVDHVDRIARSLRKPIASRARLDSLVELFPRTGPAPRSALGVGDGLALLTTTAAGQRRIWPGEPG